MKTPMRREALSRARILQTALELVDREGLEAISMRRVGEELGVEAMSLYNHLASKAAMLDGLFEVVLEELPRVKPGRSWRHALSERARALRLVLRSHPNVLPIFATRPAVTPASISHVEFVLKILRGAGFSARDSLSVLQVVVAFVVGHTLSCYSVRKADEDSHPAYERLSEQDFPRVRELAPLLSNHDGEREFEFGLEALLVGLQARVPKKRSARR